MAVVLYAMMESGVTLGKKHYEMMSAMDGSRGPDGFNHQFRKVKARAKELQEKAQTEGGVGTPVKKAAGGREKKAEDGDEETPKKKPTPRKRKNQKEADADADDEEGDESPSKKVKVEPEEDGMDGFD